MVDANSIALNLIQLGLAHAKDRTEYNEALEAYFLSHQDDWQWDGVSWDGPYRMWTLRERCLRGSLGYER